MARFTEGSAPSGASASLAPSSGPTDDELVARAQSGDRWARSALLARHVPQVAQTVARLLASKADAEDVLQDALVEALTELGSLREGRAFRVWLMRIAVGKVHRVYRKNRLLRRLGLHQPDLDATLAALATGDPEDRAELFLLDRALATLPTEERVAWMLRHVEELPLDEVADACGCSLATAKRRVARAEARIAARDTRGDAT